MENRTRVIVYGSSLNIAGIAASLVGEAGLEVVRVDPQSPAARQLLDELDPAAIAFDLSETGASIDVALLYGRPDLVLIGVDPSNNEMLVVSSRPEQAHSMADLVNVIRRKNC